MNGYYSQQGARPAHGGYWQPAPRQMVRQDVVPVQVEAVQECQAMQDQVRSMLKGLGEYGELATALHYDPTNHRLQRKVEMFNVGVGQMHNLLKIASSELRREGHQRALELAAVDVHKFDAAMHARFDPAVAGLVAPHVENMKRILQGGKTCTVLAPRMRHEDITDEVAARGMGSTMRGQHYLERRRAEVAADPRKFHRGHCEHLAGGHGKQLLRGHAKRTSMRELQHHVRDGPKFMEGEAQGQSLADGHTFHLDGDEPDLFNGDVCGRVEEGGHHPPPKARTGPPRSGHRHGASRSSSTSSTGRAQGHKRKGRSKRRDRDMDVDGESGGARASPSPSPREDQRKGRGIWPFRR